VEDALKSKDSDNEPKPKPKKVVVHFEGED